MCFPAPGAGTCGPIGGRRCLGTDAIAQAGDSVLSIFGRTVPGVGLGFLELFFVLSVAAF